MDSNMNEFKFEQTQRTLKEQYFFILVFILKGKHIKRTIFFHFSVYIKGPKAFKLKIKKSQVVL
jgi:hypothetical protein